MGVALQSSTLQLLKCNRRPQHLIHFSVLFRCFFSLLFLNLFFLQIHLLRIIAAQSVA